MLVGNVAAVFKPREAPREDGELTHAPKARSLAMAALGLVASLWALFTLVVGG
jgi:hypothetical protein